MGPDHDVDGPAWTHGDVARLLFADRTVDRSQMEGGAVIVRDRHLHRDRRADRPVPFGSKQVVGHVHGAVVGTARGVQRDHGLVREDRLRAGPDHRGRGVAGTVFLHDGQADGRHEMAVVALRAQGRVEQPPRTVEGEGRIREAVAGLGPCVRTGLERVALVSGNERRRPCPAAVRGTVVAAPPLAGAGDRTLLVRAHGDDVRIGGINRHGWLVLLTTGRAAHVRHPVRAPVDPRVRSGAVVVRDQDVGVEIRSGGMSEAGMLGGSVPCGFDSGRHASGR